MFFNHKYILDQFLVEINDKFGIKKELSVTTGKVHDYLGMTINFSLPGRVMFTMFGYLEDIILETLVDMRQKSDKEVPTPATKVSLMLMRTAKPLIPKQVISSINL